jgi:hypothetical protein
MWYWCEVKKNPRNRSRIQNLRRDVTNVTILARKLNLHQIQILISISLVVVARSIKEVFFPTNVLLPPFLNFRHRIGLVAWFLPTPPEHPCSSSVLLSGSCCFIFRFLCSVLWLLFTPPSNYLSFCLPLLLITPPSNYPSFWLPMLLFIPPSDYPSFCLSVLLITPPSVYPSFWLPLLVSSNFSWCWEGRFILKVVPFTLGG